MTRIDQARRRAARLQKQGWLCLEEAKGAGRTFLAETNQATSSFAKEMSAASSKLVTTVGRSGSRFQDELHKEALHWRDLVLQTRDAYSAAIEGRIRETERRAAKAREALKPEALQLLVLESARDALGWARRQLDDERPKVSASTKTDIPLQDYDQLTARDVVSRVQRLTAPQAIAVLDYERTRKKRATVIRAAEQRLAVAS